jgi:ubiquitin-conjugating enzyme E2 Z
MSIFIKKQNINRLIKDIKNLLHTPLHDSGIYYKHDETDILKGYALIIGPENTPYFGGYYLFEIHYPAEYPDVPPNILYSTNGDDIRFHPNLYKNRKVCLSVLNTWRGEQWTSCETISSILLHLCMLFTRNPLLNEPGITENHQSCIPYNNIIEYKNIDIAIYKILNKKELYYMSFFDLFYDIMYQHFLKNKQRILEFIYLKQKDMLPQRIRVDIYSMNTYIDYNSLLLKIENI